MAYEFTDAPGRKGVEFSNIPKDIIEKIESGHGSPTLSLPLDYSVNDGSSTENKNSDESLEREQAIIDLALKKVRELRVDFGDLRLGRDLIRYLVMSDRNVKHHVENESTGIGIRVLVKGFWGFSASDDLTDEGINKCAQRAFDMASGVAASTPKELGLSLNNFASETAHQSEFNTPVGICPFAEPVSNIAEVFQKSSDIALGSEGITRTSGMLSVTGRRRWFASTEGARILTTHSIVDAFQKIFAVHNGGSAYRTIRIPGSAGGLEHFYDSDLPGQTEDAAKEALLKCSAKTPAAGSYNLILDGHNLGLTMHESVGHPTELDRVLGYEFGFAGGSFASLDKLNNFQYGSPIVNFTANNKIRFGPASQGFDDEGVECQDFPVIRDGVLVGYGSSRETAHKMDSGRSNGNCRSSSWFDSPIVRIPNLFLEPGKEKLSREELIADTKDGILMMGRDSFSIDQMRYNFQFGADMCYRIKDGKIDEPLKDVIYQSISPEFWNSCDAICDETEWQMHGVINCGKGQPIQGGRMMHGASPSRFRNITVGY